MIKIIQKEDCVGCNSCMQRCPVRCITMKEDEQGFLYPVVDTELCIQCNLCEKVCPVIIQGETTNPTGTYAVRNNNRTIQLESSSGGIFYTLAKAIIEEGGVVFGARFDSSWNVIHDYTETLEGLKLFQGSKYVQSNIGESFLKAEAFLKEGRKVMFTGTPCQIAGLSLFLKKDYSDLLLKVDVVCHGVPSPKVWRSYLSSITNKINLNKIGNINFRNKREGWENYGLSIESSDHRELFFSLQRENSFMRGFLKDLYLRPSCYKCPVKCNNSQSDFTIGDFWSINDINPNFYDPMGVSVVIDNKHKFSEIAANQDFSMVECDYEEVCCHSSSLTTSAYKPKQFDIFWKRFQQQGIDCIPTIISQMEPSFLRKVRNRFVYIVINLIGLKKYSRLRSLLSFKSIFR